MSSGGNAGGIVVVGGIAGGSALFSPYRTIGVVCSGVQSALYSLGGTVFAAVPAGRAVAVFDVAHLRLALVSRPLPHDVSFVVAPHPLPILPRRFAALS